MVHACDGRPSTLSLRRSSHALRPYGSSMNKLGERLSLSGLAVVALTVLLMGWVAYELSHWPPRPLDTGVSSRSASSDEGRRSSSVEDESGPSPSASAEPSAEPTAPSAPLRTALLSDGLAIDAASWFNRTIAAREVDGLVPGVIASQAGLSATQLEARAALTSRADVVVVQAGDDRSHHGIDRRGRGAGSRGPAAVRRRSGWSVGRPRGRVDHCASRGHGTGERSCGQ